MLIIFMRVQLFLHDICKMKSMKNHLTSSVSNSKQQKYVSYEQ